MAEGGASGDDGDNPFSFKTFIQKKDPEQQKPKQTDLCNSRPNGDESKNSEFLNRDKKTIPADTETQPGPKKKSDDNPFSFKKFLKAGKPNAQNGGRKASDLPDFVQDHFGDFSIEQQTNQHPMELPLPDFTLPSESGRSLSFSSDHGRENNSGDSSPLPNLSQSSFPPFAATSSDCEIQRFSSTLPDFLSGTENPSRSPPDGNPSHSVRLRDGVVSLEVNGDLELEVRRFREENQELRCRLENAKKTAAEEAQRSNDIIKEMKVLRKKDAEETEAMEKMIHQVEANLTASTRRAVLAENTVVKLKQDIKISQGQISQLQAENKHFKSDDGGLADIRERTQYAAEQLKSAASTAERSLKELLSGVDNMKLLAQVLSSIDKIREEERTAEKIKEEPPKHRQQESGS